MPDFLRKRIDSADAGRRLVRVECNHCKFVYFYDLTRIGIGSATTVGLVTPNAERSAKTKSEQDLHKRLAQEAELVPCPNCNWINDELVEGYRRGVYRQAGLWAAAVVVVGTISSIVAACYISNGPSVDHGVLPYVLLGGPTLSIVAAIAIIVFRKWSRRRIQPNRHFPAAPKLPLGSPIALIEDPTTGQLRETANNLQPAVTKKWIEIQIGRHEFPQVCCICLSPVDPGQISKKIVGTAFELDISRCIDCAKNSRRAYIRIWTIAAAIIIVEAYGLSVGLRIDSVVYWILFTAVCLISFSFAAYLATRMTSPFKIKVVDLSRGIVKLRFRNFGYQSRIKTKQAV